MPLNGPAAAPDPSTATITVNVFDGTRSLFTDSPDILFTIRDGNQRQIWRDSYKSATVFFRGLPVFQNAGDNYTAISSANGYKETGFFPVKISAGANQIIDLMLLPASGSFNFSSAKWLSLANARPKFKALFAAGLADDAAAATRYGNLMDSQGGMVLGCLLNITTAMDQVHLPQGTVLDYLKELIWDQPGPTTMAQDRFYGWADPAIIPQIQQAQRQGIFDNAPFILHPGATSSYKQIQFGEANVQLTFHENNRKEVNGLNCVMIEPDIDYYKDPGAHLLLEVAVNAFGSLTDPKTVYALRWTAGRRAGVSEFDPLYTIQKA